MSTLRRPSPKQVFIFIKSWASCGPHKGLDLASLPVRTVVEHHVPQIPLLPLNTARLASSASQWAQGTIQDCECTFEKGDCCE